MGEDLVMRVFIIGIDQLLFVFKFFLYLPDVLLEVFPFLLFAFQLTPVFLYPLPDQVLANCLVYQLFIINFHYNL